MNSSEFIPEIDMAAIEGVISDLAALTKRPRGYPFSKITVYSVCPEVRLFMPNLHYVPASDVPSMRKLDFKKAGKIYGAKVQEMKNDLSLVPDEFIVMASRFNATNEPKRKTTGCRKHLIEVECDDQPERWLAIQFRKAIKKYITEDLGLNIVPAIFRDTFTSFDEFKITGKMYKNEKPAVPRVIITLGNCSEKLYQALELHGKSEFSDYPIRLKIPSRLYICDNSGKNSVTFGDQIARFDVDY